MMLWKSRWRVFALLLVTATLAACGTDSATPADSGALTLTTGSPSPTVPAGSAMVDAPASPDTPSTPTAAPGGATETPSETGADADAEAGAERATALYFVQTITCPGCANRVEASAKEDPGVIEVEVDLSTRNVTVVYDSSLTDPEQIADAIRAGGDIVVPQSSE